MSGSLKMILELLQPSATAGEVLPVFSCIQDRLVQGDRQSLSEIYDRAQTVRRTKQCGGPLEACLRAIVTMLDSYFAARERIERLEKLAQGLEGQPLWREILHMLASKGESALEAICAKVATSAAETAPSSAETVLALEDLRIRDIVELVPSAKEEANLYALTRLGRELCAACKIGAVDA